MVIGYTDKPLSTEHLNNLWDGKYEARAIIKKDNKYSVVILNNKQELIPEYDFCVFAFSYKNDTSFPFLLKWGEDWIYCAMEGDSLVSSFQVSALKDILSALSYEGAKSVLRYLTAFDKQRWVIIANGVCTFSKNGWFVEDDCSFSNQDYKKKVAYTQPSVATKRKEEKEENEETHELEGVIFKTTKPGFQKYMKATGYKVYVDDVRPDSPWHGKILPLDFVKSLNEIQYCVVFSDFVHTFVINKITLHRLPELNAKEQPITIELKK